MKTPTQAGIRSRAAAAMLALAAAISTAGEAPAPRPLMTVIGRVLLEHSFRETLPLGWRPAPGVWEVVDGALNGREDPKVPHAAVIRHPLTADGAVFSFSFRLGTARQISLSIDGPNGHLGRLVVTPEEFIVQKDDTDRGGPDRRVILQRIAQRLDPAAWHPAVVEFLGGEIVAQVGAAGGIAFGAHPLLAGPRANFGFTVTGGVAEFRDVTVRAATPNPQWPAERARRAGASGQ